MSTVFIVVDLMGTPPFGLDLEALLRILAGDHPQLTLGRVVVAVVSAHHPAIPGTAVRTVSLVGLLGYCSTRGVGTVAQFFGFSYPF